MNRIPIHQWMWVESVQFTIRVGGVHTGGESGLCHISGGEGKEGGRREEKDVVSVSHICVFICRSL